MKKKSEHDERKGDWSRNYRWDWPDGSEIANQQHLSWIMYIPFITFLLSVWHNLCPCWFPFLHFFPSTFQPGNQWLSPPSIVLLITERVRECPCHSGTWYRSRCRHLSLLADAPGLLLVYSRIAPFSPYLLAYSHVCMCTCGGEETEERGQGELLSYRSFIKYWIQTCLWILIHWSGTRNQMG